MKQKKMNQWRMVPAVCLFLLLAVLGICSLALPKENMLTIENRRATAFPSLSWEDVLSGDYQEQLQDYVNDHVALRQNWISFKCFVDELFFGKTEEDGILLGKDSQMFTEQFVTEEGQEQYTANLRELADFARNAEVPVSVMLVPSPAAILAEQLPWDAPMESEDALYEELQDTLQPYSQVLDLRDILDAHREDYIYYRTDHHWTTLGAYYAYEEFCQAHGLTAVERDFDQAVKVENFYGTHYSKTRYILTKSDTISYFPADNNMVIYKVTGDAEFEPQPPQSIIQEEKLGQYDKYAAFLDGNNGYSVIEGDGEGKILVVKDSYANCFVPFLLEHYGQVGVVDYRNYAYGLAHLVEKEGYEEVLFLYSIQGFAKDTRVVYINRP